MKQPDLGRKISELRLAKGLTQGELAERCNLSLRTIQRIESAEVMPRSYTIKLIFESLDYEIYNSFGKFSYKLDRMAYKLKIWLKQFYKYVLDLFNLKTNTMKKISVLVLIMVFIITGLFIINNESNAQQRKLSQIMGTWKMISHKYGDGELIVASDDVQSIKLITESHFVWVVFAVKDNLVTSSGGGTYTFDGENYIEHVKFGGEGMSDFFDTKSDFKFSFDKGEMKISGKLSNGLHIEQTWNRIDQYKE